MRNNNIDILDGLSREEYQVINSINRMAVFQMSGIIPVRLVQNGAYTSAIYFKDYKFLNVQRDINGGQYRQYFKFAKQFKVIKKALVTMQLDDLMVI